MSIYRHFSSLCKKISEAHTKYLKQKKIQKIEEASHKVCKSVMALNESGLYPIRRRIEELLSPNILLREKT